MEAGVQVLLLLRQKGAGDVQGAGRGRQEPGRGDQFSRVPLGPGHEHHLGQEAQEDAAHPVGHGVRLGRTVVHVEHEDGDDDGERDEDHGEEQVLANERDHQRGGWDSLGDDQQEHGQREKDRDAQGNLLAAVGGQVEDQHGQEGDEQAGDDHVDGVEERETTDVE